MKQVIIELLKDRVTSRQDLNKIKRQLSKKYNIQFLQNSQILKIYNELVKEKAIKKNLAIEQILRKRSVRTLSGIAPVAVLTQDFGCPANCAYCPTEARVPKSYLSNEPAVMRAIRCKYNPYIQTQSRLNTLVTNGHSPEKIELIVIGGTWSALPIKYKYSYIKECFRGANELSLSPSPSSASLRHGRGEIDKEVITEALWEKSTLTELKKELSKEQKKNEKAKYKIIGLTLETRPDWINKKELKQMRELGCTRVETGVQIIDDKVLAKNKRGHGVKEIIDATKLLKNWGFKVTYHFMPGLPGSTPKNDLEKFAQLFNDANLQPDQIKFYPTVVTKGSLLYKWWRAGKYKPYSNKILEKLIIDCKKVVPQYVRIIRLIRDIPAESIVAGNIITNLRQVMQQNGVKCRCIRCREPHQLRITNYELRIISYKASGGIEYFISIDSKDGKTLYGFCRLRLSHNSSNIPNVLKNAALIRELHVYGELAPVGEKKNIQHSGLGIKLMSEAEKIAKKNGFKKMAIISGVGAREYYRKLNFKLKDTYMIKHT